MKIPRIKADIGNMHNMHVVGLKNRKSGELELALFATQQRAEMFYQKVRRDDELTAKYSVVYQLGRVPFPTRHQGLLTKEEREEKAKQQAEEAQRRAQADAEHRKREMEEREAMQAAKLLEEKALLRRVELRRVRDMPETKPWEKKKIEEEIERHVSGQPMSV